MLCKKAIDAPIPTGGMIRGVLWFHLPGVRPEEINKRDCHLVLRARDAFGKDIAVAVTFGPFDKKVPVVFAGLNVPSTQIDLAGPIPQVLAAALGQGIGVWLGRVMILALTLFTICSYTILMAETSRLPMVAGWDSVLSAWFTRLNPRFRTPVRSLCVIVAVAAFASILASLNTGREEAFQLLQTSGQLSFGIYYCAMFAVPLATGARFGRRPSFWLVLCAISGLVITIVQCVLATVPIVEVNGTWSFAAKVAATALVTNLVGFAIYWRGRGRAEASSR